MADIEEAATLRSGNPLLDSGLDGLLDPQAGQPARKQGKWETIGPAACPLMYRRTLVSNRWFKVLWHRFVPNSHDRDAHDHPRSFVTLVLRGSYLDDSPVDGMDLVRAPTIRFRRAEHAHVTYVGPEGCTTLVIMGSLRRPWGFLRDGRWWPWVAYERRYGMAFRCDDNEDTGDDCPVCGSDVWTCSCPEGP